jgi:dienelactone hydrolase
MRAFLYGSCRTLAWILALTFAAGALATLPAPEQVTFPSLDVGAVGRPIAIAALYFRPPQAPPGARVPLVIAAHGCGGMFSASANRRNELSRRSAVWTGRLLSEGYAVLWPDSFNPRGRRSVCLGKRGEPSITPAVRRLDLLGAIAFGAAQPGIDRDRIALIGWSHGGSTVLATSNGRDPRIADFLAAPEAPPPLRAVVAFYPGCRVSLRQGARWQPAMPLAIHIGALDDWSAPEPCVELGKAARARGAAMTVTVYAGAYHGFDSPSGKVKVWEDVTTGVRPNEGVHVGPDPAARAAAEAAVRGFLREQMGPAAATAVAK